MYREPCGTHVREWKTGLRNSSAFIPVVKVPPAAEEDDSVGV
jgi:hypothetical protein